MAGTRVEVGKLVKEVRFWVYFNGEHTGLAVGGDRQ